MNIVIKKEQREKFKNALNNVFKATAGAKANMDILKCLCLQAQDNKLKIMATNMDLLIQQTIEVSVILDGKVYVDAIDFVKIIKKVAAGDIKLKVDAKKMSISVGRSKINLNIIDGEFPCAEFSTMKTIEFSKMEFFRHIKQTTFCSSKSDNGKAIFKGVLLSLNKKAYIAATNSHQVGIKEFLTSFEESEDEENLLIPSKHLDIIASIEDDANIVALQWNEKKSYLKITIGDTLVATRLIEGQFPDVYRVIPPSFKMDIKINTSDFIEALDRVTIFSEKDGLSIVKFSLSKDNNVLTFIANNEKGEIAEVLPVSIENYLLEDNNFDIAFNSQYILEMLKTNSDSKEFTLSMNSAVTPAKITINDENYTYIVTPIRMK